MFLGPREKVGMSRKQVFTPLKRNFSVSVVFSSEMDLFRVSELLLIEVT